MSRKPKPQESCAASIDAGPALATEEPHELWAAYLADRGNQELRNRLVEHYLPWVFNLAASLAKKMRLRDRENAVGEVLAALVASIVPGYDGQSGFERWAYACTKRKLLNLRRGQRRAAKIFAGEPSGAEKLKLLNEVPDRPHSGSEWEFGELTAGLMDRQAVVLWLRHYCGLTVKGTARVLKLSSRSVEARTRSALAALRKNGAANCASSDPPV